MQMDQDRIRAIIKAEHSYWGGPDIPIRKDTRWGPGIWDLIAQELSPTSRVLDVGCGASSLLLDLSTSFHTGIGVDIDNEALQIAEEAKREQGIKNVDFLLLDFPREIDRLQPESFDLVISLRGPIGDTDLQVQAAHHLLRPDGLIFCEEIAELHEKEVDKIFFTDDYHSRKIKPRVNEVKTMMERNGFEVRLAADNFTKWIYPDIYAWLQYQCNLWTWLGGSLPEPDDPRIALFAERNTNVKGEIEITHHVCWVAGVKQ